MLSSSCPVSYSFVASEETCLAKHDVHADGITQLAFLIAWVSFLSITTYIVRL